jgi:hypothetical protein
VGLGVVAAVGLARWGGGHLRFVQIVATPGGIKPPTWVVVAALGVAIGGAPILRGLPLPAGLSTPAAKLLAKVPIAILAALASGLVIGFSVAPLLHAVELKAGYDAAWQVATAASTLASIVFCATYLVFGRQR